MINYKRLRMRLLAFSWISSSPVYVLIVKQRSHFDDFSLLGVLESHVLNIIGYLVVTAMA